MSTRNTDGDVIANRLNLVEAKGQNFLAVLFKSRPDEASTVSTTKPQDEDEDLKRDYGHDQIGVGGIIPKDIEDGSFTKRTPTSNDKLLQQLIGKKRAKAHLAAQQEASRPNAKAQRYSKPAPVKVDSDEEEEGRAATFKSKRRKVVKKKSAALEDAESDDEDEEMRAARLAAGQVQVAEKQDEVPVAATKGPEEADSDEENESAKETKKLPSRSKAKPKSYLDEILADRSKKKQNRKSKNS